MNKKQRIVILIAVILVGLCGLFPPYEGVYYTREREITALIGHRFIFYPPSSDDAYYAFQARKISDKSYLYMYDARIVITQALYQLIIVVILTIGLVIVFGEKRVHTSS